MGESGERERERTGEGREIGRWIETEMERGREEETEVEGIREGGLRDIKRGGKSEREQERKRERQKQ